MTAEEIVRQLAACNSITQPHDPPRCGLCLTTAKCIVPDENSIAYVVKCLPDCPIQLAREWVKENQPKEVKS